MNRVLNMKELDKLQKLLTRNGHYICLAILFIFLVANNYVWLQIDNMPLGPTDQSSYYLFSLRFSNALKQVLTGWRFLIDPISIFNLIGHSTGYRPPLAVATPAPFYLMLGKSPDLAVLIVNSVFLAIVLLSTYKIGVQVHTRNLGVLTALLVSTYPIMVHNYRIFMQDFPLTAMFALSIWLLLRTDNFKRRISSIIFGISLGLGMLTKENYIIFIIWPLLALLYSTFRRDSHVVAGKSEKGVTGRRKTKYQAVNVLLALFTGIGVASVWYLPNLSKVLERLLFSSSIESLNMGPLYYILSFINIQGVLFCLIFIFSVFYLIFGKKPKVNLILLSIALPIIAFTLITTKNYRFILPIFPVVALVTCYGILTLRNQKIKGVSLALILVVAFTQLALAFYPLSGAAVPSIKTPVGRLPILGKFGGGSPTKHDWGSNKIMALVNEDLASEKQRVESRIDLFLIPYVRWLWGPLRYKPYEQGLDLRLLLSWKELDHGFERAKGKMLNSNYVILSSDIKYVSAAGYKLSAESQSAIFKLAEHFQRKRDELPFYFIGSVALPDGAELLIYRNNGQIEPMHIATKYGKVTPGEVSDSDLKRQVVSVSKWIGGTILPTEDPFVELHFPFTTSSNKASSENHVLSFGIKSTEEAEFSVQTRATDGQDYLVRYTCGDEGTPFSINGNEITYYIGNLHFDGTWQTIERNLESDLFEARGAHFKSVKHITIRGRGHYYVADFQLTEGTAEGKTPIIAAPAGIKQLDLASMKGEGGSSFLHVPDIGLGIIKGTASSEEFKLGRGEYVIDVIAKADGSDGAAPVMQVSLNEQTGIEGQRKSRILGTFAVSAEGFVKYSTQKFTTYVPQMLSLSITLKESTDSLEIKQPGKGNNPKLWIKALIIRKVIGAGSFTSFSFYTQWTDDRFALVVKNNDRRVGVVSDKGLGSQDEWHHVAVTFSKSYRLAFYIDGKPAGTRTIALRPSIKIGELHIGRQLTKEGIPKFYLRGAIDEIRIYAKALTQSEVVELFERERRAESKTSTGENELVRHWDFDQVQSPSAKLEGGVIIHGATRVAGKVGSALVFDGIDDYIEIPDLGSSDTITDEFTIAAWVKLGEIGRGRQVLFHLRTQ